MTTDRPYHRALEPAEAQAELRRHRGTQFAPMVVDAFFRVYERSGEADRDPMRTAEPLLVMTRTAY